MLLYKYVDYKPFFYSPYDNVAPPKLPPSVVDDRWGTGRWKAGVHRRLDQRAAVLQGGMRYCGFLDPKVAKIIGCWDLLRGIA